MVPELHGYRIHVAFLTTNNFFHFQSSRDKILRSPFERSFGELFFANSFAKEKSPSWGKRFFLRFYLVKQIKYLSVLPKIYNLKLYKNKPKRKRFRHDFAKEFSKKSLGELLSNGERRILPRLERDPLKNQIIFVTFLSRC